MKYSLTVSEKQQYGSILLLEMMIQDSVSFPILLDGNDKVLEPLFIMMMSKNLVEIKNNSYVPTEEGRKILESFYSKFTEYINIYDLYCAVDLESAEFAFSSWFDFDEDEDWNKFLNDERFEDVRVAVCEFKGINPVEMVFMSFVASNDFDLSVEGWQFDITSGLIWDDILEICNTSISRAQLDEQEAMEAIVEAGMQVAKDKKVREAEIEAEIAEQDEIIDNPEYEETEEEYDDDDDDGEYYVEVVEDVYYEDSYYDPYYDDIYYVSPLWVVPLLFL